MRKYDIDVSYTWHKTLVHSYCTTSPPITHAPFTVCQLVQVGSWYGFNSVLVYLRLLVAEGLFILESFITVTKLKQTELYLPLNMAESLFLQCNIPSTEIQSTAMIARMAQNLGLQLKTCHKSQYLKLSVHVIQMTGLASAKAAMIGHDTGRCILANQMN